jgi:hypothetical protein
VKVGARRDALGSSKVLVINNLNSRFQESTLDRLTAAGLVKSVHLFSFPAILDLFLVVFAVTSPASSCFAPGNGGGGVCGGLGTGLRDSSQLLPQISCMDQRFAEDDYNRE